jgi:hypothetical protein
VEQFRSAVVTLLRRNVALARQSPKWFHVGDLSQIVLVHRAKATLCEVLHIVGVPTFALEVFESVFCRQSRPSSACLFQVSRICIRFSDPKFPGCNFAKAEYCAEKPI